MSTLSLSHVTAHYGPVQALFDVSLSIAPGELLALLGRNGMGKTTTVRAICGLPAATGGTLSFGGANLRRLPAHRIAQSGIGLVPEGRRCFAPLSVQENLTVAARPGRWTLATVGALFPRLSERLGQSAATLSGGEQQMLAIGRALMTNPKLLILDEATEGLAPLVRGEIWSAITTLKQDHGLAILLIDKSLSELSRIADTAVILDRGRSIWSGPMGDVTPDLARRHLGL